MTLGVSLPWNEEDRVGGGGCALRGRSVRAQRQERGEERAGGGREEAAARGRGQGLGCQGLERQAQAARRDGARGQGDGQEHLEEQQGGVEGHRRHPPHGGEVRVRRRPFTQRFRREDASVPPRCGEARARHGGLPPRAGGRVRGGPGGCQEDDGCPEARRPCTPRLRAAHRQPPPGLPRRPPSDARPGGRPGRQGVCRRRLVRRGDPGGHAVPGAPRGEVERARGGEGHGPVFYLAVRR
mmetsp:Transcript_2985/g.7152  ORF Transcript_2985/g.7152 Transcript_2985/m.7152 type:complete len:240 (+) Transcript_2985:2-721(+)